MKNKLVDIIIVTAAALLAASCSTVRNVAYFQDASDGDADTVAVCREITAMPGDRLGIIVNSRDDKLSSLFNLGYATRYIGIDNISATNAGQQCGVQGYLVGPDGCIQFPVLGSVKIEGLTRNGVAKLLEEELDSKGLVKDAVVSVDFINFKVSVLGEVSRPGQYPITRDKFTVFDALSAAGDLTIYGVRTNVTVIRTVDGSSVAYKLDLTNLSEMYASPAFYLQQNDVIYVTPNRMRSRQTTVNGNNVLSASFWVSVASLLTTISYYFILTK